MDQEMEDINNQSLSSPFQLQSPLSPSFFPPESPAATTSKVCQQQEETSPTRSISSVNLPDLIHGSHRRLEHLDDSLLSYETSNELMPDYQRYHARLHSKLLNERNRLREAKNSIVYWRKKEGNHYSWNEICAHALFLMSEIRVKNYKEAIERIETFKQMSFAPPPISMDVRTTLTISSMNIHLSRAYYSKTVNDDTDYVFIVVGSTGEKTVASQLLQVSTNRQLRSRQLLVDEKLVFKNLPLNFRIELCIYVMKITSRKGTPTAIAKKALSFFSKITPPAVANLNSSFGSKTKEEATTTSFEPAGRFSLHRFTDGQIAVNLEEFVYPLDGTININSTISPLPKELLAEVKGYWKLYSSDGSSDQYYVKMSNGLIQFSDGPPNNHHADDLKFIIDCSTICDSEIASADSDDDAHRWLFNLNIVIFGRGEGCPEHKQFLIGIDNENEFHQWINSLNTVLRVIRGVA